MNYTDVKNMVYANEEKTLITCDVKFELIDGFISFTASPDDIESHGGEIYSDCISGKYGDIGSFAPENVDYSIEAENRQRALLIEANNKIKDWRTELELGVISDDDRKLLIRWMSYIKDIKALDLTSISDKASFEKLAWPELPA